jgi:hypothetical protein
VLGEMVGVEREEEDDALPSSKSEASFSSTITLSPFRTMQSEALLILPLSLLSSLTSPSPSHLAALREATANTSSHLTVLVRTPFFDYSSPQHLCPRTHWNEIQSYLSVIYGESTRVAQRKGRMLFKVDVILEGFGGKEGEEKRWEGIEGCPWHVIYMDQDGLFSRLV